MSAKILLAYRRGSANMIAVVMSETVCWQSNRYRRGLTLVELLTVVALMAIMLGVLLPTLTRVRAEGHRAGCRQNLIDIGFAIDRYATANNGNLPTAQSMAPPITGGHGRDSLSIALIGHLRPRTSDFQCPGDAKALYAKCSTSYFYDTWLSGVSLNEFATDPAGVPMLWDADMEVFLTRREQIIVPRFHEYRQALFGDLSVGRVADERTRMLH